MSDGLDALTDKEKDTLRLMLRGHDAKSMARKLELSVHTINERLRNARRKLGVSSSREAARKLAAAENAGPKSFVDKDLGGAGRVMAGDVSSVPEVRQPGGRGKGRTVALLIGVTIMTVLIAALLLSSPLVSDQADAPAAQITASDAAVDAVARRWLKLVDAGDWKASYAGTASQFRTANTLERWSETASHVQGDLGKLLTRKLLSVDDVPSPQGLVAVKYRADYTNRSGAIETVSLVREDGTWKVAGIYVS